MQAPIGLLAPNATLLRQNKNGKVYSLATDQMSCLVPNAKDCVPIPNRKFMTILSQNRSSLLKHLLILIYFHLAMNVTKKAVNMMSRW